MSVIKALRQESKLNVLFHVRQLSQVINQGIANNFGYNRHKALKIISKEFGGKSYDELNLADQVLYTDKVDQYEDFVKKYLNKNEDALLEAESNIRRYILMANSIWATNQQELNKRKEYQVKAISECYFMISVIQDIIDTIPVSTSVEQYAMVIDDQISMLLNWKDANKRFKKYKTWVSSD